MGDPQAHPLDARVQAAKPALGARQPRLRQELAGALTQTADGHQATVRGVLQPRQARIGRGPQKGAVDVPPSPAVRPRHSAGRQLARIPDNGQALLKHRRDERLWLEDVLKGHKLRPHDVRRQRRQGQRRILRQRDVGVAQERLDLIEEAARVARSRHDVALSAHRRAGRRTSPRRRSRVQPSAQSQPSPPRAARAGVSGPPAAVAAWRGKQRTSNFATEEQLRATDERPITRPRPRSTTHGDTVHHLPVSSVCTEYSLPISRTNLVLFLHARPLKRVCLLPSALFEFPAACHLRRGRSPWRTC